MYGVRTDYGLTECILLRSTRRVPHEDLSPLGFFAGRDRRPGQTILAVFVAFCQASNIAVVLPFWARAPRLWTVLLTDLPRNLLAVNAADVWTKYGAIRTIPTVTEDSAVCRLGRLPVRRTEEYSTCIAVPACGILRTYCTFHCNTGPSQVGKFVRYLHDATSSSFTLSFPLKNKPLCTSPRMSCFFPYAGSAGTSSLPASSPFCAQARWGEGEEGPRERALLRLQGLAV